MGSLRITLPKVPVLKNSVGINGANDPGDVETVQKLLNLAEAKINVDRNCGRKTIAAICNYQRQFLPQPDGLIKPPQSVTFQKLLEGKIKILNPWGLLPADGYHVNYCKQSEDIRDLQWGTPQSIGTIQAICRVFFLKHKIRVQVGDISLVQGGPMHGHTSGHRIGKNADIRPIRKDRANMPCTVTDPEYDREATLALAKVIESQANVRNCFFGDEYVYRNTGPQIELEKTKHHNHFHVQMFN